MEIARHRFYRFELDPQAATLAFRWTPDSAAMTDDDYRMALLAYAECVQQRGVQNALIDLSEFRHQPGDAAALGAFWAQAIATRYDRAGLRKFAFVVGPGEAAPPDDAPADLDPAHSFATRRFGSEAAAQAWLRAG